MIQRFSDKQKEVLSFIFDEEHYLICDGSVRSGKTTVMIDAFLIWAMEMFDGTNFAICSHTVASAERNVVTPMISAKDLPYRMNYRRSDHLLVVRCGKKENRFYLFGGKDESSYALIQGITLAGVLLDEVALMPRSFVEQAMVRTLTYPNRKIWFNCNPEGQLHWFNQEWIIPADEGTKPVKHLHFLMQDNPAMSDREIRETENMFSGVFYQRYILGLWVAAEGLVYDMFSYDKHVVKAQELQYEGYAYVSCDFGIQNANVFLLWRKERGNNRWVIAKECYYSGRTERREKSVSELADMLEDMIEGTQIENIVIDPSASALKVELRKRGYKTQNADNDVLNGIMDVATMLQKEQIAVDEGCKNTIMEFGVYAWNEKAGQSGVDVPLKENDHAMDAVRYFVKTKKLVNRDRQGEKYDKGRYITQWH